MHSLVVATLLIVAAASPALAEGTGLVFDFSWDSASMIDYSSPPSSRSGVISGHGTATVTGLGTSTGQFSFLGAGGNGSAILAFEPGHPERARVLDLSFPSTIFPDGKPGNVPPAFDPRGGIVLEGDPAHPSGLSIFFSEFFACTAPCTASDVIRWQATFEGVGTTMTAAAAEPLSVLIAGVGLAAAVRLRRK
jgi:hypothetical protein